MKTYNWTISANEQREMIINNAKMESIAQEIKPSYEKGEHEYDSACIQGIPFLENICFDTEKAHVRIAYDMCDTITIIVCYMDENLSMTNTKFYSSNDYQLAMEFVNELNS